MTNRKEIYTKIFKWCADVGHCPLESDMNELIDFIRQDEPTPDMLENGIEACWDKFSWAEEVEESDLRDLCRRVYRAMISAHGHLNTKEQK